MASKFTIQTIFQAVDSMTKPIRAMTKSVDDLGKATAKSRETLKAYGAGILKISAAATAAAAATVGLAVKTSEAADSVVDTASAIGVSTRALQEYRYVAALAGMTTDDMDSALTKLTINLGKGGDAVTEALGGVGLSIDKLKAAGPDQALETIADALAGVEDPTKKAAVVTALFGKSSVRMVNALSQGSAGLRALREEAGAAGYVMGEEALKAGTSLGDSLDRLKATFAGVVNTIGGRAVPAIQALVDRIAAGIRPGGEFEGLIKKVGDGVAAFAAGMGQAFVFATKAFKVLDKLSPVIVAIVASFAAYKTIMAAMEVVTIAATAAQWLLNGAMLANPVGLIILAVSALIGIVVALIMNWKKVGRFFKNLWAGIVGFFRKAWQVIVRIFKTAWDAIMKALDNPIFAVVGVLLAPFITIPLLIIKHWKRIVAFFAGVIRAIVGFFQGMARAIAGFFIRLWNGVVDTGKKIIRYFSELLDNPVFAIAGVLFAPFLTIPALIIKHWEPIVDFFKWIFGQIGEFVGSVLGPIVDFVDGLLAKLGLAKKEKKELEGGTGGGAAYPAPIYGGPAGGGTVPISSSSVVTQRGIVDVNFTGAPAGTTVKASGAAAPRVSLRTGGPLSMGVP